jgi:phage terminase large subunit
MVLRSCNSTTESIFLTLQKWISIMQLQTFLILSVSLIIKYD